MACTRLSLSAGVGRGRGSTTSVRHARVGWTGSTTAVPTHAVSFADMLLALRRVILAAQYLPGSLVEPTTAEILAVQRAWAAAAA